MKEYLNTSKVEMSLSDYLELRDEKEAQEDKIYDLEEEIENLKKEIFKEATLSPNNKEKLYLDNWHLQEYMEKCYRQEYYEKVEQLKKKEGKENQQKEQQKKEGEE